jgi:hypothetical protein
MSVEPRMRRWTDRRDGRAWRILYAPGVEEDTPAVRHARSALVFEEEREGGGVPLRAPAVYGSDLVDLSDGDLQGLIDQAREAREGEGKGVEQESGADS